MTESATFTYLKWQDKYREEKPYQVFTAVNGGSVPTTNLVFEDGPLETVHDVRDREHTYSLDREGFAFIKHNPASEDFDSVKSVESKYLPKMEALLQQTIPGIDRVCFFDWRIRRNKEVTGGIIDGNDRMQHFLPARHAHIDQTPAAVVGRVFLHLPDDAAQLLTSRVRVINMWRPLVDVVEDQPLAVCDIRTARSTDLVEADHVRKHYTGSNYYMTFSDQYKWYYLSKQRKNEVILMQMFDSAMNGVSGCPHSSFAPLFVPDNAMKRESIEVRALVFTSE